MPELSLARDRRPGMRVAGLRRGLATGPVLAQRWEPRRLRLLSATDRLARGSGSPNDDPGPQTSPPRPAASKRCHPAEQPKLSLATKSNPGDMEPATRRHLGFGRGHTPEIPSAELAGWHGEVARGGG